MDLTNQPIMDDIIVYDDEAVFDSSLQHANNMTMGYITLDFEELNKLKTENIEKVDYTKGEECKLNESCYICGKYVEYLDKHMLTNHSEPANCQLCSQTVSVSNLRGHILKEHYKTNMTKVTKCSLCEQQLVTKNALKIHVKQTHLSDPSTCSICHKEFKDLYHHLKYRHKNIKYFKCSYCDKKLQAKKLLYNHVQSVHLGEKTNCPDCKKNISIDNFNRHVKEVHKKIKKLCPHCEKEFSTSTLRRHINTAHTKCSDCGKMISSINLNTHMKSVHNKFICKCPDCGKAISSNNLTKHIKAVHKKFICKCPDCGKAVNSINLTKHIRTVHNKLKKICNICNVEVPYFSISVHKRKVHNLGKSIDDVTTRGSNLKLRNRSQEIGVEDRELKETEDDTDRKTLQFGDKKFTFSIV